MKPTTSFLLASLFTLVLSPQRAKAATSTWKGGSTGWGTAANWVEGTFSSGNTRDVFFYNTGAANLGNNLGANRTIRTLTFNANSDSAVTIYLAGQNSETVPNVLTFQRTSNTLPGVITVDAGALGSHNIGNSVGSITLDTMSQMQIIHNGSGTLSINRPMSEINGAKKVVKSGTGYVTFGADHSYTGGFQLDAGTVGIFSSVKSLGDYSGTVTLNGGRIGSASANGRNLYYNYLIGGNVEFGGTGLGAGTLTLCLIDGSQTFNLGGATRTLTVSVDTAIRGVISNGGLTKAGPGTLTLSATANTYTGTTTINAGTLQLNVAAGGSISSSSALTLGGGTFKLTGTGTQTFNGLATTADSASRILLGSASETLTLGTLTAAGANSALNFDTAAGGANADTSAVGTGLVVLTGQTAGSAINPAFTVTDAGGFGLATVDASDQVVRLTTTPLLPALGATSDNDYRIDNNGGGSSAAGSSTLAVTASESAKSITVDTTAASGVLTLGSGVVLGNNIWNFGGNGTNTYQITGSADGAGLGSVAADDPIRINDYNTGVVTIDSPIVANGTNAVNVGGAGTVVFGAANTYTGVTTITSGTLQVGGGGTVGALGSGAVVNNGSLVFNRSDSLTTGNTISGSGSLTQDGSGTLILTADNTYSGVTTITGGTLQVGGGGTAGALGSGVVVNNGSLVFNRSDSLTTGNTISGSGSLTQNGSDTLTLTGVNTFTGGTTVNTGTLNLDNTGHGNPQPCLAPQSDLTINNATINLLGNQYNAIYGTTGGMLTLNSGATLKADCTSNNSHNLFNITMAGGTLAAGTGAMGVQNANFTINGAVGATENSTISAAIACNINGGSLPVDVDGGKTLSVSGVLANKPGNANGLTKSGAGTLTLDGTNTYTGTTTISAGTLALGTGGSINNSAQLGIDVGGTFDVSALASPYALSAGTTLAASGTGTTVGTDAAAIKGASGGTVDLGAQAVSLTWGGNSSGTDSAHPSLVVTQGTLALGGNTFTVVVPGTALDAGVYTLVSTPSAITGTVNATPAFGGNGLAAGMTGTVAISGSDVILTVSSPSALHHFAISTIPSPLTLGTPVAGITITAQDASNNPFTGFAGTVDITCGAGGLAGTSSPFVNGQLTVGFTPAIAGTGLTLAVTRTGGTETGTSNPFAVQTQYQAWATGAGFTGDANHDGIANGLAWLLGATDPSSDISAHLPKAANEGDKLVMTFECLKSANRGPAVLKVQYSNDLGHADPWTSHEVVVPDDSGPDTGTGIVFTVTPLDTTRNTVKAAIPTTGKVFARLSATEN